MSGGRVRRHRGRRVKWNAALNVQRPDAWIFNVLSSHGRHGPVTDRGVCVCDLTRGLLAGSDKIGSMLGNITSHKVSCGKSSGVDEL